MANHLHKGDLPADLDFGKVVAIDCETMGLNPHRDRLCLVQLSAGDGDVHLVQIEKGQIRAPNLEKLLADAAATPSLDSEGETLRSVFERGHGKPRLLMLLSPT